MKNKQWLPKVGDKFLWGSVGDTYERVKFPKFFRGIDGKKCEDSFYRKGNHIACRNYRTKLVEPFHKDNIFIKKS